MEISTGEMGEAESAQISEVKRTLAHNFLENLGLRSLALALSYPHIPSLNRCARLWQ
jgi:hypothetical protein